MNLKIGISFIILCLVLANCTGYTIADESLLTHETSEATTLSNPVGVTITKPKGFLYLFNIPLVPLPPMMPFDAIIIGMVTVTITSEASEVEQVEFYVDNQLKATVTQPPYTWDWNEPLSPPPIHTLKVTAHTANESSSDQVVVLYINPFKS